MPYLFQSCMFFVLTMLVPFMPVVVHAGIDSHTFSRFYRQNQFADFNLYFIKYNFEKSYHPCRWFQ
jgi:hypothetical protein